MIRAGVSFLAALLICGSARAAHLRIKDVGPATRKDAIELRGLAAGQFDPAMWEAGKLNLVRDVRFPLIEPKMGQFRNIYAPSVVKSGDGWTIFYGAWDGTSTPNDRIHRADADAEFLKIGNRHTVIEHGAFQHVCNVNVTRDEAGGFAMMCTAYPDVNGCNKPIVFFSKDGERWNGDSVPHAARMDELVSLGGYENFKNADINGMNVLLRDDAKWRMYFGDFHNFGKTFAATSDDALHFKLVGQAVEGDYAINDVKKLKSASSESWYLAGFHMNDDRLFYSLSKDALHFPRPRTLIEHAGDADRYMVAIGFVVDGDRVLGALYGAGAKGSLDQNRIFAVWLQKKVIVKAGEKQIESCGALGPDRQFFPAAKPFLAHLELLSENGESPIADGSDDLQPGRAYQIR